MTDPTIASWSRESDLLFQLRQLREENDGLVLKQGPDYERGFVDGMQKQMQSSVDRAVNQMAQQEPVLWEMPDGKTADKWALQFYGGQKGKPLYSTPPQRQWVGLTDDEIKEIIGPYGDALIKGYTRKLFDQIEAKLKEKNT